MRDGCGRGCNEFCGSCAKPSRAFQLSQKMAIIFLEIVKAAAGLDTLRCRLHEGCQLWALAIALATGKNTKLFGVLDQNENGFFTYVSQRAGSKAATVVTSD